MIAELLDRVALEADIHHDKVMLRVIEAVDLCESRKVRGMTVTDREVALGLQRARGPHGQQCRCTYCLHLAIYTNLSISIHKAEKRLRDCATMDIPVVEKWIKKMESQRAAIAADAGRVARCKPGRLSLCPT